MCTGVPPPKVCPCGDLTGSGRDLAWFSGLGPGFTVLALGPGFRPIFIHSFNDIVIIQFRPLSAVPVWIWPGADLVSMSRVYTRFITYGVWGFSHVWVQGTVLHVFKAVIYISSHVDALL